MIKVFKKELNDLEKLVEKIRSIPAHQFECEDVLDLLNPIIRKKEEQIVQVNNASCHFEKLGNLYEVLFEEQSNVQS